MSLHQSGFVVMMTLVGGGLVSFWGPVIGAVVFLLARDVLGALTKAWMLWFGLLFMAVVLFKPEGIAGILQPVSAARCVRSGGAALRRLFGGGRWRCSRPQACTCASATASCSRASTSRSRRASSHGIMGPNGAGKTTCFNVLTGRYKPDRGRVRLDGEDITGLAPHAIAGQGVARSFQIMNLFDEFTALDNVIVALPAFARARLRHASRGRRRSRLARRSVGRCSRRVGLARQGATCAPRSLPYGERRALEIARRARRSARACCSSTSRPPGLGADGAQRLAELVARAQGHAHDRHHRARHGVPVRARRPHLGHPLGPGHRAGHAGRAAGRTRGCRRSNLGGLA